jgi:alpha-glucosidase
LLDQYPDTTMVGEIGDDDGLGRMAEYTSGGDKLHMAYCFDLLGKQFSAPFLHGLFSRFLNVVGDGWPCWALSNHDCVRVASRWGGEQPDARLLRLAAALQMTLRGSPCVYQGDELGLTEASIAFEDLQDPFGIAMWPKFKGRDGCRTPMPWAAEEPHGGFGAGKPWLPSAPEHTALAVDRQQADPASLLHYYTGLLHWRRDQPALLKGSMQLLPLHEQVLAFERAEGAQRLLCVFNFSAEALNWELPPEYATAQALSDSPVPGGQIVTGTVVLQPWGGLVASL